MDSPERAGIRDQRHPRDSGVDSLNDHMASLEARGLRLGYTPVSSVSDYVTIPDGAVQGIIASMAILSASDFNGTVSESLKAEAAAGMRAIRRLAQVRPVSQYPDTLPLGHGTQVRNSVFSPLFTGTYKSLARLVDSLGTSFASLNTPKRITAEWNPEIAKGLNVYVSGRIQNASNDEVSLTAKAEISATGDGTYTFHIVKNGVSQVSTSQALTATATAITLTKALTLEPGEWVEIWVEADTATNDVNLTLGEFRVE